MRATRLLTVVLGLTLLGGVSAHAEEGAQADQELARQIRTADSRPVEPDKFQMSVSMKGELISATEVGVYPRRKGVILVTPDRYKNLIPTGHAGIILNSTQVVESIDKGVVRGSNDWYRSKNQAYGVTVRSTSGAQDRKAADWANKQYGKPYNFNFLDKVTQKKFYCSQLVWSAFKNNFNIDLDTAAWGAAIHPMELVTTNKTHLVWRKK